MTGPLGDSLTATLAGQTGDGQILRLPWHSRSVPLGTFFNSAHATNSKVDPFAKESAFEQESLDRSVLVFDKNDGNVSYRSSESTSSSISTDHLSVGLGIGISVPCLSVSVSGRYDRNVMENNDASKTSIMTNYRAGFVSFLRPPELSEAALITLKYGGGLDAFKKRWGDYYVAGYRIGGDAGIMLSQSSNTKHTSESYTVVIKVEILFFEFEESWSESWSKTQVDMQLNLCFFSSLKGRFIETKGSLANPEFRKMLQQARQLHRDSQRFHEAIELELLNIGITEKKSVTVSQCERLCQSGAVIELVLAPVEHLRELQYWIRDDNIICL